MRHQDGKSRGFGFVTFKEEASADKVLAVKDLQIDGRKIDPKRAVPKDAKEQLGLLKETSRRTKKLFIGGLSQDTPAEEFEAYFAKFGTLTDTIIMTDRGSGKSRGFGFVTYESDESVEKVMAIPSHTIHGKVVECKKAVPREESTPAPRSRGRSGRERDRDYRRRGDRGSRYDRDYDRRRRDYDDYYDRRRYDYYGYDDYDYYDDYGPSSRSGARSSASSSSYDSGSGYEYSNGYEYSQGYDRPSSNSSSGSAPSYAGGSAPSASGGSSYSAPGYSAPSDYSSTSYAAPSSYGAQASAQPTYGSQGYGSQGSSYGSQAYTGGQSGAAVDPYAQSWSQQPSSSGYGYAPARSTPARPERYNPYGRR